MALKAPLREAPLLFPPRRENLDFLRGLAMVCGCLASLAAPPGGRAQDLPLRSTLSDALPAENPPGPPVGGAAHDGKPKLFMPGGTKTH